MVVPAAQVQQPAGRDLDEVFAEKTEGTLASAGGGGADDLLGGRRGDDFVAVTDFLVLVHARDDGLPRADAAMPNGRSANALRGDCLRIGKRLSSLVKRDGVKILKIGFPLAIKAQRERAGHAEVEVRAQSAFAETNIVALADGAVVARVIEIPAASENIAVFGDLASD